MAGSRRFGVGIGQLIGRAGEFTKRLRGGRRSGSQLRGLLGRASRKGDDAALTTWAERSLAYEDPSGVRSTVSSASTRDGIRARVYGYFKDSDGNLVGEYTVAFDQGAEPKVYIGNIEIHDKKYRGGGIARRWVERVEQMARDEGITLVQLWDMSDGFWEHLGYSYNPASTYSERVIEEPDTKGLEDAFLRAIETWDSLQDVVITERLQHVKIRKHTRHWDGEGTGDKALDPQYAVEINRWARDILQAMQPLMQKVVRESAQKAAREMVRMGITNAMHARGKGDPKGRSAVTRVFGGADSAQRALRDVLGPLETVVTDAAKRHSMRVMDTIRQMDAEGASINQIQRAIREEIGIRSSWREQLARYLTTALTEGGKEVTWKQAGNLVRKTWHTREDERVRTTHRRLNGREKSMTARFKVGKYWMKRPLDPSGGIEETINCRCFLTYDINPEMGDFYDEFSTKGIVRDIAFWGPRGYRLGEEIRRRNPPELRRHAAKRSAPPVVEQVHKRHQAEEIVVGGVRYIRKAFTRHHKRGDKPEWIEMFKNGGDSEYLASLVGSALGAPVPDIIWSPRKSDPPHTVYVEYVRHRPPPKSDAEVLRLVSSPAGIRAGLLDALIGERDRVNYNWGVVFDEESNDQPFVFDFEQASWQDMTPAEPGGVSISPDTWLLGSVFARHFVTGGPGGPKLRETNPLTSEQVEFYREALQRLEPEFKRAGREGWYATLMHRFELIAAHAAGDLYDE